MNNQARLKPLITTKSTQLYKPVNSSIFGSKVDSGTGTERARSKRM